MNRFANIVTLAKALESDDFNEMLRLFADNKFDINQQGRGDLSPLHLAVNQGKSEYVRLFLLMGANPNHYLYDGDTPLSIACEKGDLENMKILLQHPRTRSPKKKNIFINAKNSKNPQTGKLLIKYGFWPQEDSDIRGNAALSLQELIAAKIHTNPEIKDCYQRRNENFIPLHLEQFIEQDRPSFQDEKEIEEAIEDNNPAKLLSLLMNGLIFYDMGSGMSGDEKFSYLGHAAYHGYLLIAKILIVFGGVTPTQTAENDRIVTAFDIAREQGHTDVANLLSTTKMNQYALLKEYIDAKIKGPEEVATFFENAENQLSQQFDDIFKEVEDLTAESSQALR